MKVTTQILSLAAAAGMALGTIGASGAVASADTHSGAESTCGAPQRTNAGVIIDGIPTIDRQSGDGGLRTGAATLRRSRA